MSWQYILKADWEFITPTTPDGEPIISFFGQYNPITDMISINLNAYTNLMRNSFEFFMEHYKDEPIMRQVGDITFAQAFDTIIGKVLEELAIDRLVSTMQHESIHEAQHLIGFEQEVIKLFSAIGFEENEELFSSLSDEGRRMINGEIMWEQLLQKFYDELFVRIQQGDTYESALTDTSEYIKNWMEEWKTGVLDKIDQSPLVRQASINIFSKQINSVMDNFRRIYVKLAKWLSERNVILTKKMTGMVDELGDSLAESIKNMSEKDLEELDTKWRSALRAQSHLTETGRKSYEEHKDLWVR